MQIPKFKNFSIIFSGYTKIFILLLIEGIFNGFNLKSSLLIKISILLYPKSIKYLINPGKHSPWKIFFSIIRISFLFFSFKKYKKLFLHIKFAFNLSKKKKNKRISLKK